MGLLEWSDGLVRSLGYEIGMQLVDLGWLLTWQLVIGLWLEEAGHFRVGYAALLALFNWVILVRIGSLWRCS